MNQEFDDYDIPNEQQIYASFLSKSDISKLYFLFNYQSRYEIQHIIYLFKYFMELTTNKLDLQYMNIYAICLSKLTNEIKTSNPPLITQLLSHVRDLLKEMLIITDLHVAFLQSCIMSYNYKIGYQFIKSTIFFHLCSEKKNLNVIEYFYFAGLIANAQQDYEEALRLYKIAYKFQPQSNFTLESQKMESLLCFRLGLELKNWSNPINQQLVTKLLSVIENNEYKETKDRDLEFIDKDTQICLKEWSLQAQLYQFLKKEQELHSKVSFDLIIHNFQLQEQEKLIDLLLQVNKIHNMFAINEEKCYIEFKYNTLTYKEINSKLENRYDLLKQLAKTK